MLVDSLGLPSISATATMPGRPKKILFVTDINHVLRNESAHIYRVSWDKLNTIVNFADFDSMAVNFGVRPLNIPNPLEESLCRAWATILSNGGIIICHGVSSKSAPRKLLELEWDIRPFDVSRAPFQANTPPCLRCYLDRVVICNESINFYNIHNSLFRGNQTEYKGRVTSYGTVFGLYYEGRNKSSLAILPPTGKGPPEDDAAVAKFFLDVDLLHPLPEWIQGLRIPEEIDILQELERDQHALTDLQSRIAEHEAKLSTERRWYQLLYADGPALESIVKEALEFLGARVIEASSEKEDWRIEVPGHIVAIAEIKGTHNPVFGSPAIRALAGWMDEFIVREDFEPKGVFIGNTSRKSAPHTRGKLIDGGSISLAKARKMTLLRTMDLFAAVVLKKLGRLDCKKFWSAVFTCIGEFNASELHEQLPEIHRLNSSLHSSSSHPPTEDAA